MDPAAIVLLAGAAAAKAAAPGPCILVAASRSASSGVASGLCIAGGAVLSNALLLGIAWLALAGMLAVTAGAADLLRSVGIVLLLILAVSMLWARPLTVQRPPVQGRLRLGDGALGLALGLTNPMNLIFVFALLPQFVELSRFDTACIASATAAVLIGGAVPLIGACVFASALLRPGARQVRAVTRLCGVALLGFAGLAVVGMP